MVVYGDSLATNLFHGLQSLERRAGFYQVKRRTRGATGLVRDDQYDWYALVKKYLPKDRPDIVVVTFGGNDRQNLRVNRNSIQRFSPPWWREYRRRVNRFMGLLSSSGAKVYWLGLPVLRSRRMTADYKNFNALYEKAAEEHGITFVDVWDRFQDAGGGYTAYGAGIDGKRRKLRHSDGIHFVSEGGKVLASKVIAAIQDDAAKARVARKR